MTTSVAHCSLERLSAFVDGELPRPERARVERHLAGCESCRARATSLGGVADAVRALGRLDPPATLDLVVVRRVALERERAGLGTRLRRRLEGVRLQSTLMLGFALVVAFALMIFSFAHQVERRRQATIPVLLTEGFEAVTAETVVLERGGRRFLEHQGRWREQGVEGPAERVVAIGGPEWQALCARHPELGALADDQAPAGPACRRRRHRAAARGRLRPPASARPPDAAAPR